MSRAGQVRFTYLLVIAGAISLVGRGEVYTQAPGQTAPQARPTAPLKFPQLPTVSPLGARNDHPNPYRPGVSWGLFPNGRKWSSTAGVAIAPDGTIWALDRCGSTSPSGTDCHGSSLDPIVHFDPSGKFLNSIGAGMIVSPHKLDVDRDGNVWVADRAGVPGKGHQVLKFSPDGKVLMALGTAGVSGPGVDTFDQPTDVAIAPNGDIFVSDGHANLPTSNARIMKFDKTGKFIKTWGKKGTGPGELDNVHCLTFDSRGRLFVCDRQNNRIQIFDQDGKFIDQWAQFGRPSGISIDRNDVIYVADSESRDGIPPGTYGYNPGAQRGIRIGNARDGSVRYFIPDPEPYPYSGTSGAEGVVADNQGNVWGAENTSRDVKKYVKR